MVLRPFLVLFVVLQFLPLHASAQAPGSGEVDRRIALFEAELGVAYEQGVNKAFREKVRDLDLKYFQALDRALEAATKAARLEEALAIREEKIRFSEASGVPESSASDPAALTQLRGTYHAQLTKLEAERDLAATPILAEHDAKLDAYQTLLTTEGKLDEALKVKQARGSAPARLSLPATAAPTAAPAGGSEGGWHVVFGGDDLGPWKPRKSSRNFPVTDGILAAKKAADEPDYLFFKGTVAVPEILRNFELKATVKADPEANSGFYFHLDKGGAGQGAHPTSGLEVSLHSGTKPAKYPTGAIYGVTETKPASVNQAEWFELHFKVVDRVVTIFIDGKLYLEHLAPLASEPGAEGILEEGGRIAIQANSKDGGYYFQEISIKPLD